MPPLQTNQISTPRTPMEEEELDSPIDSISNMSLEDEATDALPALPRPKPKPITLMRPELSARSSTDPSPSSMLQGYFTTAHKSSSSQRNRSPYSRSHLRSRSSGAALLSAPAMTRAHSMPNPLMPRGLVDGTSATPSSGSLSPGAPHSPMRSPARVRSPFREDGGYPPPPRSPSFANGGNIESIQEDSELEVTPRPPSAPVSQSSLASFSRSGSLRRRPASPLHALVNAPQPQHPVTSFPASVIDQGTPLHFSTTSSGSSSPSLRSAEKYNEAYPLGLHHYASTSSISSMPSTPTSARSRSPSISSLETIEDAPDLESEAVEAERIERLKMAAERQERMENGEESDEGGRRRSSLDVPRSGFARGGSRERKRWSICGGERRGDLLDLETIWED